jgi:hypothetical protein
MKGLPPTTLDISMLESKLLYLLLLRSGQYTFLPDLYDAIGEDNDMMIRLLSMFAGQNIDFPDEDKIGRYIRDIKMYFRLHVLSGRARVIAIEELAAYYDLDQKELQKKYHRMRKIIEESGIATRRKHG